jgi:hypothetical protein
LPSVSPQQALQAQTGRPFLSQARFRTPEKIGVVIDRFDRAAAAAEMAISEGAIPACNLLAENVMDMTGTVHPRKRV